jgi:hypothetical protein
MSLAAEQEQGPDPQIDHIGIADTMFTRFDIEQPATPSNRWRTDPIDWTINSHR